MKKMKLHKNFNKDSEALTAAEKKEIEALLNSGEDADYVGELLLKKFPNKKEAIKNYVGESLNRIEDETRREEIKAEIRDLRDEAEEADDRSDYRKAADLTARADRLEEDMHKNKRFIFDVSADAWIRGIEIEAENEEQAREALNSMDLKDIIDLGYVKDFALGNIDVEVEDDDYSEEDEEELDEDFTEDSAQEFLYNNAGKFVSIDGYDDVYVPRTESGKIIIPKKWWKELD